MSGCGIDAVISGRVRRARAGHAMVVRKVVRSPVPCCYRFTITIQEIQCYDHACQTLYSGVFISNVLHVRTTNPDRTAI